jgi:hypothetical protein
MTIGRFGLPDAVQRDAGMARVRECDRVRSRESTAGHLTIVSRASALWYVPIMGVSRQPHATRALSFLRTIGIRST